MPLPPSLVPPTPAESSSADACLNCGAVWTAPRPNFCPVCGQETRVRAPTVREFAQQFGGAYFATEGALWRTLKLLLLKPGELTRQYLAGRRKHYVLPLRLYLTISVFILLGLRLMGASKMQVNIDDAGPGKGANLELLAWGENSGVGLRNGVFYCNQMPEWVCTRARRHIDIDPKAVPAEIDQFKDRFLGNLGGAMFLLLPSFALWLKLVYLNRRMRYTEHLIFALHVHTFWFLALALIFTDVSWLATIGFTAVPVYTFLAMRRVYGGRRWPRLLRGLVVSLLYLMVMSVALSMLAIWTLLA